ncbi:MAG: AMP-binding protein [Flavobacteriales bacterium]|nr:AMP-binding protein [Flavobacteriales bacterium]
MSVNQEISRLFEIPGLNPDRIMFKYVRRGAVQSITGLEIDSRSTYLAYQLVDAGIETGDRIISFVKDLPTWNIVECAVLKSGAIHVPLPVSVSENRLLSVISMVRPVKILVDSAVQLRRIRSACSSLLDANSIWLVHELEEIEKSESLVTELNQRINRVKPQNTAVILFTSGSTGASKGVMLSHRNILVAAEEFSKTDVFQGIDKSLSVLPMSHSAARKVNYACQLKGITICYSATTISLLKNLQLFEVQHVALVPFLLQKLKNELGKSALSTHELKTITCGGAPLSAGLWHWFENLGVNIFEVYGLTETASLLTYSTNKVRRPNCVGIKAKNIEIRITEKSELEVKGPTLLQAYMLSDGSVLDALNDSGWFNTGDNVSISEDGGVQVTGRTTRSYKTERGNFLHPEDIERSLVSLSGVEEAYLIDDSLKPLKVVLVTSEAVPIDYIHKQIRQYNHGKTEDLQIDSFSVLNSNSIRKFRKIGEMKLEKHTFTKMMRNQKFTKI